MQTLYSWRKRFGGLDTVDLKRLLAERDLEVGALKDIAKRDF